MHLAFRSSVRRFSQRAAQAVPSEASKARPSQVPETQGRVVVVSSGKGGVGKTTAAASFSYGLAKRGLKTVVVDFDIGLRNLDLHLGAERRVIFDFVNVIQEDCVLNQALIRDRRNPNLYLLAASQTRDKDVLTIDGVGRVLDDLKAEFDYVVLDSPAGIENGAKHAMYFADDAIITTNPELSACRDSDKMIGFIASRSKRAEEGRDPVNQRLLDNRFDPERAASDDMLQLADIQELLGLTLVGVIPESKAVLTATNLGQPVISIDGEEAAEAFEDTVARFLGEDRPMRFTEPKEKSWFDGLFRK